MTRCGWLVNSFPYTKEICSDGWWGGLIRCENKGLRGVGMGSFCLFFCFFLYKVSLMLWCLDLEL